MAEYYQQIKRAFLENKTLEEAGLYYLQESVAIRKLIRLLNNCGFCDAIEYLNRAYAEDIIQQFRLTYDPEQDRENARVYIDYQLVLENDEIELDADGRPVLDDDRNQILERSFVVPRSKALTLIRELFEQGVRPTDCMLNDPIHFVE